jgi:CheY-like chemotaxis protein
VFREINDLGAAPIDLYDRKRRIGDHPAGPARYNKTQTAGIRGEALEMNQAVKQACLDGLRVLVVEDEALAALQIEDMLESLGCAVIGPAARVQHAVELVEREQPDAAVLDLNVAGELVYPVAEALAGRNRPFLFATGLGVDALQVPFDAHPVLQKPYSVADLRQALLASLAEA